MIVGIVLFVVLVLYFFYKYLQHNNKKFKVLEQAIHNLTEKIKAPAISIQQPAQPAFIPSPLFVQQSPPKQQQPVIIPPSPPTTVVVVDTKVLDTELSEELKELNTTTVQEPEPEGRIDTETKIEPNET
jgi:hypothetical protein